MLSLKTLILSVSDILISLVAYPVLLTLDIVSYGGYGDEEIEITEDYFCNNNYHGTSIFGGGG